MRFIRSGGEKNVAGTTAEPNYLERSQRLYSLLGGQDPKTATAQTTKKQRRESYCHFSPPLSPSRIHASHKPARR